MIRCPNCMHREITGALFCSECGARLDSLTNNAMERAANKTSIKKEDAVSNDPARQSALPGPAITQDGRISLKILQSGEILPLVLRHGITMGRAEVGQLIVPDVDLSPYQAFKAGVSRLHAALQIQDQRVVIVELGSANGTRVNDKLIKSHTSHPLQHGDVLTLGKLKIQVLFDSGEA